MAKTKNTLLFSISGSSRFIYTPTKKVLKIKQLFNPKIQQNPHFPTIHSKNPNIAPNIVKPHKNQHFLPLRNPNPKPQFNSLPSYINTKIQRKSTLLPITNFSSNLPINLSTNPHQIFHISHLKIIILYNNHIKHSLPGILRLNH